MIAFPNPEWIDLEALAPPSIGERIVSVDELNQAVAPIYNVANLRDDSSQLERHHAWMGALHRIIGDGSVYAPRLHPDPPGWCIVSLYEPAVGCRPVIANSNDDLSPIAEDEPAERCHAQTGGVDG